MVYVRYLPQREGAMHLATLDTAWVCKGATNGNHEDVLFPVPQFSKNAVYDLDWSPDKQRILFACGNDQFPNLTRDGDIFEYNLKSGAITNRTNNWELWSNHCAYSPDGREFAYSHYANFVSALPTDIFIQHTDGNNQQVTYQQQHPGSYPFCTLTGFTGSKVLYRRGLFYDNSLFEKGADGEQRIFNVPGFGGIALDGRLYAATGLDNSIYLFTRDATMGSIRVAGINDFAVDNDYNVGNNLNTHLNWLGRQRVKIKWSTGDTTFAISVRPGRTTTYYCTVTDNNKQYTDTIKVKVVAANRPVITKTCFTLTAPHSSGGYQWLLDGAPIAGATDSTYTPEAGGNYSVSLKNAKGVATLSQPISVTASEADSLNALNSKIQILPDPSSSIVRIVSPTAVNVSVINEQGKIMLQKKGTTEISMGNLPDGKYSIMLYDDNCLKLKTRKIILQR